MTPPGIDWRRNLVALWFAEFTAIFGFSFAFPFIPLFLRDLGVHRPDELATWTGLVGGASGFAQAVASPLWGILGDRYGRKAMLLRSMVGGGVTVGLFGLAQAPHQLLLLRALQGASSGTVAAATAIVASGTPRARVGWAMGVLTSSVAIGGALGPVVGGVLAVNLGVRAIFFVGGAALLISTLPVLIVVREPPITRHAVERDAGAIALLRAAGAGTLLAVAVLLIAQALLQVSYSGFQPLIVLRLLAEGGGAAAALTGVTFGLAGVCSALAAITYPALARRTGFLSVAAAAALLLGAAEAVAGFGHGLAVVVAAGAAAGLFYGAAGPALSSMLGLETPVAVQARVFGFSASAIAIGFGFGPLLGGELAALRGVPVGIAGTALFAAAMAGLLALRGREPAR